MCRGVGDYMLMLCIPLWIWLKKLAERVRLSGLALNKNHGEWNGKYMETRHTSGFTVGS